MHELRDTRLIGRLEGPEFAASYWGVRPWHDAVGLDLEFHLADLWRLLDTEAPYLADCVRVSRARSSEHDNRRRLDLARHPREGYAAAAAGQSLTVNHLQRFIDPSGPIGTELSCLARAAGVPRSNIQAAAFYSAPDARAFGRHSDPNHVFSVQADGCKAWALGDEAHEEIIALQPGHVLYVPTGWQHAVQSRAEPTLSINFIVKPLTWRDALTSAFARQVTDTGQDLPWGWLDDGVAEVPDRITALVDSFAASRDSGWTRELAAWVMSEVPASTFAGASPSLSDLSVTSRVARNWSGPLQVTSGPSWSQVRAVGRAELRCPAEAVAVLSFISDAGCCGIEELPGDTPPEGKLDVVRQLALGGYLTVFSPGDAPAPRR